MPPLFLGKRKNKAKLLNSKRERTRMKNPPLFYRGPLYFSSLFISASLNLWPANKWPLLTFASAPLRPCRLPVAAPRFPIPFPFLILLVPDGYIRLRDLANRCITGRLLSCPTGRFAHRSLRSLPSSLSLAWSLRN